MKQVLLATILLFSITTIAQSQIQITEDNRCGQEDWLTEYEEQNPGYKNDLLEGLKAFKAKKLSEKRSSSLVLIPVHVIIVHPPGQSIGTGVNFSMEHVQSQIDVINQDFGQYNSDSGNTPAVFPAGDTGIQFCLATVDPDGNPTDGITRYGTNTSMANNSGRTEVIAATKWPREDYMNIWSAPNLPFLGLASVPGTGGLPNSNQDFVLVASGTFGGPGFATDAPYNLGRTTTHEVGHWLGLFHIWGNGGCGADDGITDTPIQQGSNFGCPNHPSPSCSNGGDMFMNYMDYVDDNCMNAFTVGQGAYMNTILSTSRASLQGSAATACAFVVPLVIDVLDQQDPSCADTQDGYILVEASGGSPGYSYSIDGGPIGSSGLFTDLTGGTHTIEVFDADGITTSVTVFLNTPVTLTGGFNIIETNDCPNNMDGVVIINVSGGTNPYQFSLNMGQNQSSNTFENLQNGFYTYNIIDENGCEFEDVFELGGGTALEISLDSINNLTCGSDFTGAIFFTATGGEGVLQYSLDGINFQDTISSFVGLDGGDYIVTVIDEAGCTDTLNVDIMEPDPFWVSFEFTDVTCNGGNDGSIDVTPMGGNGAPFQFSFDSLNYGGIEILDSLQAGEYTLYALDSLGCLSTSFININEPDSLTIEIDPIVSISCFGDTDGSATINAAGGNGLYSYIFEEDTISSNILAMLGAGMYDVAVLDSLGCTTMSAFTVGTNSLIEVSVSEISQPLCYQSSDGSFTVMAANTEGEVTYEIDGGTSQASPTFSNLSAGDYQVIVSDESGCNASIIVTIPDQSQLLLSANINQNVSCNGGNDGSVTFTATGGNEPYIYEFDNTDPLDALPAGDYSVKVTDNNQCITETIFTITEPVELVLTVESVTEVNCATESGGGVTLSATGGNGSDYSYSIFGDNGTQTTNDGIFTELPYGSYVINVTDEKGCITTLTQVIPYENMFSASIVSVTDISCFGQTGGSLDIDIEGGTGEVMYLLNGAVEVDPNNLDISAEDYTLSIIDSNGCTIDLAFTLAEEMELTVAIDIDTETDVLTAEASGGTEPYLYSFDGGNTYSDKNTEESLPPGEFTVFVRDANGCIIDTIVSITDVTDISTLIGAVAYPNPFDQTMTLNLNFSQKTDASIEIFDLRGQLVYNISDKKYDSGENFVKLDLSNFVSSIYIVKIASAEGYRYIKVTKM